MFSIRTTKRYDQTGFQINLRGQRWLALHWWSIWRPQQRNDWGFLFTFRPFAARCGKHSATMDARPLWRRVIQPTQWMQRTLAIGRNTRGGTPYGKRGAGCCYALGHTRRRRFVGWCGANDTPYSFQ